MKLDWLSEGRKHKMDTRMWLWVSRTMEIDVKDEELNNNNNQSENGATKLIDTINNNINSLFEKFSRGAKKIDTDESPLPSPKAMLETIMPCEKLCSSFRQIADDLSDGEVIKTHIKHEISEPKLASDGEDFGREQFPLNLKSFKHGHEKRSGMNVSKLRIPIEDEISEPRLESQRCCVRFPPAVRARLLPPPHASHFSSFLLFFRQLFPIHNLIHREPLQHSPKWTKSKFWCLVRCDLIYIQTSPCSASPQPPSQKCAKKTQPHCDHHCCFLRFVSSIAPIRFQFLAVSHSPRIFSDQMRKKLK